MATATKAKNGNVPSETLVDFAEETQVVVNAMLEATNLASENGKLILDAQKKVLDTSLELSQQYAKVYSNFFIDAMQLYFDQSMAVREQTSSLFETNYRKLADLTTSEQNLSMDTAKAYQTQAKAAYERMAEMFTPVIK